MAPVPSRVPRRTAPCIILPPAPPDLVNRACEAAEEAFWSYGYSSRKERAAFLRAIADEIEARADEITEIGSQETGLPEARLQGERGRTTGQLRLFADHIEKGDYLDRRLDAALPDRQPAPRPEIRLVQRPIGPVAVFGASNFPLAFSTAGGDTAAALAAGCPVVVKGHSAHPGTGEIVAQAIEAAIARTGVHPGVFSLIQGGSREVGHALVQHPLIKAVGFTGSLAGGRALFDLCAARPEPIPFFGELGSVNPMFLLPRGAEGAGRNHRPGLGGLDDRERRPALHQPGHRGGDRRRRCRPLRRRDRRGAGQGGAADHADRRHRQGLSRRAGALCRCATRSSRLLVTESSGRAATPNLFETTGAHFLADHALGEEVFGPLGLVVRVGSLDEMEQIARGFDGQLTATIHMDAGDLDAARRLRPVLERKAGRVLVNGFPTGVEVVDSMVHGGPYPASTNFGATSVGTMSIRRFLRPVSYQNMPEGLLPEDFFG